MKFFFKIYILLLYFNFIFCGCAKTTFQKYSEFVVDLDDKSELSISTYPTFYPKQTFQIPFIYSEFLSHEKLYFQVFIRDKIKKSGSNPNIESIVIHSFSYQLDNQQSVELISEYRSNFWKQEQQVQNSFQPLKFSPNSKLDVKILLTLNGQKYIKSGLMIPKIETKVYPLMLYLMN